MVERRADRRYMVERLSAAVDGNAATIIDISQRAVRVAIPPAFALTPLRPEVEIVLLSDPGSTPVIDVAMRGWLIRCDENSVVYEYEAPMRGWEARLLAYDRFEATALSPV